MTDGPPPLADDTPVDLRGLINFVNSRATSRRPERFGTPATAAAFLALCELDYDAGDLSARDIARLRRMRDAIVRAIQAPTDARAWDVINEIAGTTPLHLRVASGPTATLQAARANSAETVIARLLGQIANAVATARWDRLGACAGCQRVFYDNTRSHTRRWCSYATCGNRANVAAYRSRRGS
jgi:predicted RNA-binding Zn ribbon-like protein